MEEDIKKCVKVLQSGGTILYPTDTIWGIGCDATNENAAEKVYNLKKRPENKSFIILLDDFDKLKFYLEHVPEKVIELVNNHDKPLTVIYPKAKNLAKNVVSTDGSIAIRIVKDDFCNKMIREFGKPVVSSSANITGEKAPLSFLGISEEIIKGVDYVVKFNHENVNEFKPSTIIKMEDNDRFVVIRE